MNMVRRVEIPEFRLCGDQVGALRLSQNLREGRADEFPLSGRAITGLGFPSGFVSLYSLSQVQCPGPQLRAGVLNHRDEYC